MSLVVDIKKDFGRFRLDVEFEAGSGEVTGLLGASGCGKSVTLKCVAGIEKPDEGRIVLDGRVLFDSERRIDLTPQRRRVGYLFQNYALFPNMILAQNIAVGVRDRAKRRETVERLVKSFYLEGCEGKYPRQLSGGQQQRAALARILASEPEVLMLDEPFSALDSYLKWQVELEVEQELPDGLEYAGIRAHFVEPVEGPGPNRLLCRVERVVTEAFSTVVMLATPGGSEGYSRLRMELPQERWAALAGRRELYLELAPERILPLRRPRR